MESLISSVGTVVSIVHEVMRAVETVSRNKKRCHKLAKRVQGIGGLLRELHAAVEPEAGPTADDATRSLLRRLDEALRHALRLVQSCSDSRCPCRLIAGRRMSDQFDEVNGEIDGCLLDLGVANRILLEKLLRRQDAAAGTETVTVRIGMPCDDSADHIKRCIKTMTGVTEVSAAASTKDQFRVTVRSGAVDIPSLLDQVEHKLNRNVELITPAATTKDVAGAGVKKHRVDAQEQKASVTVENRVNKQRLSGGCADGDEIKKEKVPANMAGMNQQAPAAYAYMPFPVALVPVADVTNIYQAPPPCSFFPYPQGPPVHAQMRQANLHRVHYSNTMKYDGGGNTKHAVKDNGDMDERKEVIADDSADPVPICPGKTKDGDNTTASRKTNVTAIGVPVGTVSTGVHELVPPPSYGYGYWAYAQAQGRATGDCCHCGAGSPSESATYRYNYNHHSSYPDMFSDENPNACSIM
ncbi:hypothetical protein ACP70R_031928 [Stipagrostis hirtigluma subsp. patula]